MIQTNFLSLIGKEETSAEFQQVVKLFSLTNERDPAKWEAMLKEMEQDAETDLELFI